MDLGTLDPVRVRWRTGLLSLLLSLVLHAALALLLVSTRQPPPPPAAETSTILSVDLQELPLAPPPPAPPMAGAKKAKRAKGPGQRGSSAAVANEARQSATSGPVASAPARPADVPPRLTTLLPSDEVLPYLGTVPGVSAGPSPRGVTLHNDGAGEDPRIAQLRAAHEAEALVGGWMQDDLADIRVANGLADTYFHQLGKNLEKNAQFPLKPDLQLQNLLGNLIREYGKDLEQYGKTGQPGGMAALGPMGPDPGGPLRDRDIAADNFSRMNRLLEQTYGFELIALVEIRQAADGHVLDSILVKSSGNQLFDAHAVSAAPASAQGLDVPERVSRSHPDGIRTVWEFRGKPQLRKRVKDLHLQGPLDAAYLAGMGILSLGTGLPFDETTGDVWVLDLRDPKIECHVQLLRLY